MNKRPSSKPIKKPSGLPSKHIKHSADKPSYTSKPSRPVKPKK
ncbi:hypothetical protein [Halolactibacillus sp. JCM 19043]|nr:hypothetical protein [Halolactibacillus sp. JCM 19043]